MLGAVLAGTNRTTTFAARRHVHVCDDGSVTYEWDEQACKEAAEYPVSEAGADMLRGECTRNAADLGPDGVRSHTVRFSVTPWDEPPGLPDCVPRTGCISRGDVLDLGQQVRARTRPATDLLAASFTWGWGTAGYGPRRLRGIRAAAGDRLEPSLQNALDATGKDPSSPDPIAGYACLYGGYDYQERAAPGQEPWSRLHGFGPAFFTKFLYFSTPGALILDNQRRPQAEPTSQPRHRGRPVADVDALPLLGLPAVDDPDGPDCRSRTGPSGTDLVPAAGKSGRGKRRGRMTDGR